MKYRVQSNRAALVSSAWRILVVGGSLVVSLTVASMGHFLSSRAALDFRNSSRVDVWQNHTENAGGLDPSFNLIGEKEIPISPNNG